MLSQDELQLVQNSNLILTKNAIIQKVYNMFGNLSDQLQMYTQHYKHLLPANCCDVLPKISRGEKYEGLPYVILDYPRLFGKEDMFAVRNFFWWGNYFSTTLHVRGKYLETVIQNLVANIELLSKKDWYISATGNEWTHNIYSKDFTLLNKYSKTTLLFALKKSAFIKTAVKLPLKKWSIAEKQLETSSIEMITLLQQNEHF